MQMSRVVVIVIAFVMVVVSVLVSMVLVVVVVSMPEVVFWWKLIFVWVVLSVGSSAVCVSRVILFFKNF